jgi:hypothetical protein
MLFLQISESEEQSSSLLLTTEFFEWCCKYFTVPMMSIAPGSDPHGSNRFEQEYRYKRASRTERLAAEEQQRASMYLVICSVQIYIEVKTNWLFLNVSEGNNCCYFYAVHVWFK